MRRAIIIGAAAVAGALALTGIAEASVYPTVSCTTGATPGPTFQVTPKQCSFSEGEVRYRTRMINMRRRSWGGPTACGRGTLTGNGGYRAPVRLCLYDRGLWESRRESNMVVYRRLRLTIGRGCICTPQGRRCGLKPYRRHVRVPVR